MVDNRTSNLGLPLPYRQNLQSDDCVRIAESFTKLDDAYGEVRLKTAEAVEKAAGAEKAGEDAAAALELAQSASLDAASALGLAHDAQSLAQTAIAKAEVAAGSPGALVVGKPRLTLASEVSNAGAASVFTAMAQPMLVDGKIDHFLMSVAELGIDKQSFAATNNYAQLSFAVPQAMAVGSLLHVSVTACDGLGNASRAAEAVATVVNLRIAAAEVASPASGEINVPLKPTIMIAPFATIGGLSDTASKVRVQVATDAVFENVVWDSGDVPASQSVTVTDFLDRQTVHYARARWTGETWGAGPWSAPVPFTTINARIVAVCQCAEGSEGKSFQRIQDTGEALATNPDFTNHPVYAGVREQVVDGQYMVGFPKCFVKRQTLATGQFVGKDARFLSELALPGYDLHPAFLAKDGNTALDMIWIGKYQACDDGGTKAGSKPGVKPLVSIDFPTMQTRCSARNAGGVAGFHLWNVHEWSLVQLMFLLEYAGTDSQAIIGRGHVDNSPSGVQNADHATVAQASWRGLVGLWGNVWQMCDGLRMGRPEDGGKLMLDMGKGLINTTISGPANDVAVYPNRMFNEAGNGWNAKHLFLPDFANAVSTADADAAYPDQSWYGAPYKEWQRVLYVGGYCSYAASAGLFCLYCYNNPSYANGSIGGRLAKW